jgi:anti-sigma regulatory factor (Ser/Thr protein kinase)
MNFEVRQFPARITCLTEVLAHIASICKQAGLEYIEQMRVELVIEELYTNTVNHGYKQNCELPIWISAEVADNNMSITYQDAAPFFNPLERQPNENTSSLGGVGVTIIQKFAQLHYFYKEGRNTLILIFPLIQGR